MPPLSKNEAELELATAWKHYMRQPIDPNSAAGKINIANQFKNNSGNNPRDDSTHEITDGVRQHLIKYWGKWRSQRLQSRGGGPNAQTLNYTDPYGNYYNVDGSVSGGTGVIHFIYRPSKQAIDQKFNWHFRVV